MAEVAVRSLPAVVAQEWIKSGPPAMRFILHGDAAVRAAAATAWGVGFAAEACRAMTHGSRATLWLGPDEYLLLGTSGADAEADTNTDADTDAEAAAADAIQRAVGDLPHALVDISHRQFALEVSGPHAAAILIGACPLDLDIGEFPVGMCTRTVFAKADIVLWRIRDDAFHLEVWRSFSGYVTGLLSEIAREFYA